VVQLTDAAPQWSGYMLIANVGGGNYGLWKLGPAGLQIAATAPHTFSAGEEHFLYLAVAPDGSGGIDLTGYVDGAQAVTYHDASSDSPLTGGGIGLHGYCPSSTTGTGAHALYCQTDPQVSTLTGPTSGPAGAASSAFTLALEVPAILGTTATLSDGGAGGTFTPSPLAFAGATATAPGASTAAYTYTASGNASGNISLTSTVANPAIPNPASPWTYSVSSDSTPNLTPTYCYFDSSVSGLARGQAATAVVTPRAWNGTIITALPAGTYSLGPIVESADEPGSYACRIGIRPTQLPAGTTPRFAWTVAGSTVVDVSPQPASALLDGGLSWGQAINQILAGIAGMLSNVPTSGAGVLAFKDPAGASTRIAMRVDGSGNRTSIIHNPPIA
jgi:hypothetical protein